MDVDIFHGMRHWDAHGMPMAAHIACLQNESISRELSLNLGAANHNSSNQTCDVR